MRADGERTATGYHMSSDGTPTGQRYTVHEAALLLGLSVEAVRKRAERGRLKKEKAPDGTVYILLDASSETGRDRTTTGHGTRHSATGNETATRRDALVSSLQDQIQYLRHELEIRNEELRRKDHLLAVALERIPELESSKETATGSVPKGLGEGSEGAETREGPRRSWWRRYFGF